MLAADRQFATVNQYVWLGGLFPFYVLPVEVVNVKLRARLMTRGPPGLSPCQMVYDYRLTIVGSDTLRMTIGTRFDSCVTIELPEIYCTDPDSSLRKYFPPSTLI